MPQLEVGIEGSIFDFLFKNRLAPYLLFVSVVLDI